MTGIEYQDKAMFFNDGGQNPRILKRIEESPALGEALNGCLGLAGEVGEFNDMIKKWVFHEWELDPVKAKKELGDILWYVAIICHAFGWDIDEVMQMNIDKLYSRYPQGFDPEKSKHRKPEDQ